MHIIMMNRVNPEVLGTVNGVQGSIQTIFDMLAYILSIALSNTSQFKYLVSTFHDPLELLIATSHVTISFAVVGSAAFVYLSYAVKGAPTQHALLAQDSEEMVSSQIMTSSTPHSTPGTPRQCRCRQRGGK